MAISQFRSKRKPTGGRYKDIRKKRLCENGSTPTHTRIGVTKVKKQRVSSGMIKPRLLLCNQANVLDPKTKKATKSKIITVLENPANRNYVRRNIITKGTIINTEKGKAKVTSRPGQEGIVNAVLIE